MPWTGYPSSPAYGTQAWKRARLACLRRARYRCELRLDGCQGAASQADHVDGLANDPEHKNLRAVCASCHGKRTAQQASEARRGRRGDPAPMSRIIFE